MSMNFATGKWMLMGNPRGLSFFNSSGAITPPDAIIAALDPEASIQGALTIVKTTRLRGSETVVNFPFNARVYVPLDANGGYAKYHAECAVGSDPFNAQAGSARILRATLAQVYASANVVNNSSNLTAGAQQQTPSLTKEIDAGTGRTETGTWNVFTTGVQSPKTRYSSVTTSTVAYTVTGVTTILWRFYCNAANGGTATITITESGAGIPAANWLAGLSGGNRVANQKYMSSTISDTNIAYAPLAFNLNPAKTYVVTITHASGTRMYDSGLLCYNQSTFDGYPSAGQDTVGTWDQYAFSGGFTYGACLFAGSRKVITLTNTSRIALQIVRRPNGAYMGVKVFDSGGNEINTALYQNLTVHANGYRYIDEYAATPAEATVQIADGLTKGTYYVHVWSLGDRSTAFTETTAGTYLSSQWAVFINSATGYDTSTGVAVTASSQFQRSDLQILGNGSDPLDAMGNEMWAGQFLDTGDGNISADAQAMYVTQTHGAESTPTNLVVKMDGVTIDWAGAANLTEWTGVGTLQIDFDTAVYTQKHPTTNQLATMHYTYVFSKGKVTLSYTFTTIRSAFYGYVYGALFLVPNTNANALVKLDGGIDKVVLDVDGLYTLSAHDGSIISSASNNNAATFVNNTTAVTYRPSGNLNSSPAIANGLNSRVNVNKVYWYYHSDTTGQTTGSAVGSGFTMSGSHTIRMFYGRNYAAALGV